MRIEELILEGFKSYPVRTSIKGWDSSFNAITGLNGSGKSNILDAICFVLGITNMTSVRASNLLDLIYKRGQAGVTKASVTIIFDNSDRSTSPVGFENHRQITVTRQIAVGGLTKYLLNGHKSTLQTLQNLFQSVQLNINNPNFLIMQGKITKVLNMKPQEILGMVEEASGTRMFEDRKDKAVKTMAKKDKKVGEMEAILNEEIIPKLDALRAEKRAFLAFQKATSELERLERTVRAAEWQETTRRHVKSEELLLKTRGALEERRAQKGWLEDKQHRMEREVADILKKREKELAKGGKLAALQETVKELGLGREKIKTQLELKNSGIADEEERVKSLQEGMKEIEASRGPRSELATSSAETYVSLKATFDVTMAKVASDEELLQTLLTGLTSSSSDEAAGGYMGQLAEAKARLAQAGTEADQAKMRIEHGERGLKEKEPRAKKAEKEGSGLAQELEAARVTKAELEAAISKLDWDEEEEKTLLERKTEIQGKMNQLMEQRDSVKSRLASIDFSYSDPVPHFDRTKVKGLVANLVELDEANFKDTTALEICAGGRLYNVIVEDEKVAAQLLSNKGSLKKRVTLLPLNKIQPFVIPEEKVAAAEKIAPGRVNTAISLVGYPEEVSTAMAYVFGGAFICTDKEAANKVTFNKAIGVKTITVEGDVYDPSGSLSGGAAPKGGGVLVQVQKIRAIGGELNELKAELAKVDGQLQNAKVVIDKFRKAKRELDLKSHEVGLLEEQVNGSNAAKIVNEVAAIKANIAEFKQAIADSKEKQKQAKEDVKRLEREMDDFKNNKDAKLNEIKASIVKQKKESTKQGVALKAGQKSMQTTQLELEQVDRDLASSATEIEEAKIAVRRARAELASLEKELTQVTARFNSADEKLRLEQAALAQFDEELHDLEKDIKHKKQEIEDNLLATKKLEHDLTSQTADQSKLFNVLRNLEKQYPWILEEFKFFGHPGGPYDFSNFDLGKSRERVRELEEQQKGMRKKVNPKVMGMIDNVEKKEVALKKMMATVLKDKGKIEGTITELDRYKRDALRTTWEKVNGDFGAIFAELLPGNFAKLQPPEGMDITEGLEVKIRLGSVWKASLTELSGGQRSLIALSLIMSLLQFKPAPMYILDEIDAALDLSHTQHIGQLFKNRFKGSQFIVVSLKEGLFTNANVLFKAKFVDGTSTVERTVTRSADPQYSRKSGGRPAPREKENTSISAGDTSVDDETSMNGVFSQEQYSQFDQPPAPAARRPLIGR